MTSHEILSGGAWGSGTVILSQILLLGHFPTNIEMFQASILASIGGIVGAIARLFFFYVFNKIKKQWLQKQLNKSRRTSCTAGEQP
jgi:hypothetical protein